MGRWALVGVLVLVPALIGCAPPAPVPEAADPTAPVVAALLAVDPCLGRDGRWTGPHTCTVDGAQVVVGRPRGPGDGAAVALDGVRALRAGIGAGTSSAACRFAVPVTGDRLVVAVTAPTCPEAEAVARAVPAALGAPVPPGSAAAADRDACSVLTGVLPDAAAEGLVLAPDPAGRGLDGCRGTRPVAGGGEVVRGLEWRYDAFRPVDGPVTVAGRPGGRSDLGGACAVEWSVGPSGIGPEELIAVVRAPECAEAERTAADVTAALAGPPPDLGPPAPGPLTLPV